MSLRTASQRRLLSQKLSSTPQLQYFKDILNKVGIILQTKDTPNIFHKEQSLIIRDLQKELEKHANYPHNIDEFITGLKHLTKKEHLFKKALLPSQLQQITDNEVTSSVQQENVFRILLSVDCLQSEVISLLLEEVTTHAIEDENDTIWLRLLLGPLRYLSYIKDAHTLTTKLLEILEVATFPAQLEILNFMPDIIPDSEYDNTARHLSKILNENTKLTGAIIDCLNYLNLNVDMKAEIQDRILAILNTATSMKIFSTIFCFLITDCKPDNLINILLRTRNALDSIMLSKCGSKENASNQVLTFEEIRRLTMTSKTVSEAWINLINSIRLANDHKSVDIIILLMLHSTGSNRKHPIETLIKKKIKNRQFKPSLMETTLKKYLVPQLLKDYMKSILEIASCLLRAHSEPTYTEFAKIFYVTTFAHKHSEKHHRQQILNSLILLTGSGDGKRSTPALSVLTSIAERHQQLLQPHTMQLMGLLDKLEEIDLKEVQQMFDLLCGLTCGPAADDSMNMFQNDIHMLVRKQLSSSKKNVKYRGIISAVSTARNIATVSSDEDPENSEIDESYNSISDLPVGPSKQAATLLELANTSTSTCPIAQGLYYDQLAQMVTVAGNLDKHFMVWLFDVITNDFQRVYVSDNPPVPIKGITLKIEYNINSTTEMDSPISINIAELTIKTESNNNAMLMFAPLFRLLRLIHYRQHSGDLSSIDALLGCGIVMPELDPDLGIDIFDTEQSKHVIDCLFHCINWFREIISAFVKQKGKKLQQKILLRLKHLVELEGTFANYMKSYPDHKLPMSDFYNINLDTSSVSFHGERSKPTESRKRKKGANMNNTTRITQTTQTQPGNKPGRKPQNKEMEQTSFQFREMDTDIIVLLQYQIDMDGNDQTCLTLPQFKFIMKDLVMKLNIITKSGTSYTFTHLIIAKPEEFVTDCVRLMPRINNHLIKIIDEINKLLTRSDGIHDAHEMFLQTATELKISFGLILEMLALMLGWVGFQDPKNLPLLRECLRALVDGEYSQLNSAQRLILEFTKCVMKLFDYCLTLPCAVHLVNIMKALCTLSSDQTPHKNLILLSGKLLAVRWFTITGLPETGAVSNVNTDILVKAHLSGSNVTTISSIVSWVQEESATLTSKDCNLTTFPSINKLNFPILYRGLCTALVEALNNELTGLSNNEHLTLWFNVMTTMRSLMNIVKAQDSRTNLSSFLKRSMSILKIFLSHGLPILEIKLRTQADKVIDILKTLQQTTRFIHNICCHTKLSKDNALIAYVPQMRLTLESLVYHVKAALTANNCSAAFWMGNLRNKNLLGEEILSQGTNSSQDVSDAGQSEDELPPEDDSESDAQSTSASELKDSASEIY